APEAARDGATVPLVEVAEEHARPDEPRGVADEPAEQLELCAPLGECQPQVAVGDVERRALDVEVHPQGPAGLARAPGQGAALQAAVEADAPMDVVAHDPEGDHAASRACLKCAYSSTGWTIADGSVTVGGWMTNVCSSSYDVPAWAPTSSTNDTSPSGASIP